MLITFLNTQFNKEEVWILHTYIEEGCWEFSVVHAIDAGRISGVDVPHRMIYVGGLCLY